MYSAALRVPYAQYFFFIKTKELDVFGAVPVRKKK